VEPFGNIRRDGKTGEASVQPIREPLVDLFEEGSDVLVVADKYADSIGQTATAAAPGGGEKEPTAS
jgi:HSP20 family protein